MRVYVDHTHLGRAVTGLERITLELFSATALAPLDVVPVTARGTAAMVATQTFALPALLARSPSAILLCPGFPPSPLLLGFGERVIPYVHDVFLLSRRHDLNRRARLYMAQPFRLAVRRLPGFLVNSEDTQRKLAAYCRRDARIMLYRPQVRNVFGLRSDDRAHRPARPAHLRLVALGTVEPRKNFLAAAAIAGALRRRGFANVTLDVIGRNGWGDDWARLEASRGVTLHGYLPTERAAALIGAADAFICTSHEEGLGLPLLEAQYAGLPVIAPNQPVFREVLGASGLHVDPDDPESAADVVAACLADPAWRTGQAAQAARNLRRWNALAGADRDAVIDTIGRLARSRARGAAAFDTAPASPRGRFAPARELALPKKRNHQPMHASDLIFDVGMHLGEDSEFYLEKGFRVVGIEADPAHCAAVAARLAAHVASGRLTIVNAAIADRPGRIAFYRNLDKSIWGTAEPDWVERNAGFGTRCERIAVDAVPMESILAAHGVPYYMKIDIEGRDMLCVAALRCFEERPKYLSVEASKTDLADVRAEFELMRELGYRDFKVVAQHAVQKQVPPRPSREGRYADWSFAEGSSGLFGEETPGDWLDADAAMRAYRPIFRAYRMVGDKPLIKTAFARNLLRHLGYEAGWHDTHARLGNGFS